MESLASVASTVVGAAMTRLSAAVKLRTVAPDVSTLAVLGKVPSTASTGTWSVTVKTHEPEAGTVRFAAVKTPVPVAVEPAPQKPVAGSAEVARPVMTAPKSSVKVTPDTAFAGSGLVTV